VLHEVGAPVVEAVALRGVAEVDGAVGGHRAVVAQPEAVREYRGGAGAGVDAQQPAVRVADDEVALGVDLDAERAAAGVDDHLRRRAAVRVEPQHVAVPHAGVEPPVRVDHDVLRTDAVDRQELRPRHGRVAGPLPGPRRRRRRMPDHRLDPGTLHGRSR
jgi:hypothetical protein